jgi:hypothetical protein
MDIIKTNSSLPQNKLPKTLSQLLTGGGKNVEIAISEYAIGLSATILFKNEQQHKSIKSDLDTLQNSLRFYQSSEAKEIADKERLIDVIKQEIAQKQEVLASVPKAEKIRDLIQVSAQEKEAVIEQLIILNVWLMTQLNLTQALTANQNEMIALTILDRFSSLSIEEVMICYKEAVAGKYGKIFNRIDVAVVSEWLSSFVQQKQNRLADINYSKHSSSKDAKEQSVVDNSEFNNFKIKYLQSNKNDNG